jgi:hypothetical protein
MIIDIQKGGFAKGIIEYHERKVEKGKAVLLNDNTYSENKDERVAAFLETAATNPAIRKNKFLHISVSFNLEDRDINEEKMLQIAREYLQEMGITNTPVLIYEHADMKHKHFHIVTTTMDFDGKKIPEYKDYQRSQVLSRKLEKEHGLVITQYENKREVDLKEINARYYRLHKALSKELPERAIFELQEILTKPDMERIKKQKMRDTEIEAMILERGDPKDRFHQLYRILTKHNLIAKSHKQELMEQLTQLRLLSKDREEFLSKVEQSGLYVRKIATGNNTYSLTYGNKKSNFYVKEKDLPYELRYDYLYTGKKLNLAFDPEQQRSYLKRAVTKALRMSGSREEFERLLKQSGVSVEFQRNSRGIYGVSFISDNVKDAVEFKGSQLDRTLSWNAISKGLRETQSVKQPAEPLETPTDLRALGQVARELFKNQDDETTKNKRKNNDQNQDLEKD